MKEFDFIKIIKKILDSDYIGDDCAILEDLGIAITQDTLVEDVHFLRKYSTPFDIGYKSIAVNLSDIYASGSVAKYLTVSLSLPDDIEEDFVKEFYMGAKKAAGKAKIVGGDITASDKVFVSVCVIGAISFRKISSRKNAKQGYKIITNGVHGSSAAGFFVLKNNIKGFSKLIDAHLRPNIKDDLSSALATLCSNNYAMMDSSDGLMDSLLKISVESDKILSIDFSKIPYDNEILQVKNFDYENAIFYGGEDYKMICAVSEEDLSKIDKNLYTVIGEVKDKIDNYNVEIIYPNKKVLLNALKIEENLFKHFN